MNISQIAVLIVSAMIVVNVLTSQDKYKNLQPSPTGVSESPRPSTVSNVDPQILTDTVKQFYSKVSSKQFDKAWELLSKNFKDYSKNYNNFVKGYDATKSVLVQDLRIQDLPTYTVFVKLQSADNFYSQIQTKDYSGTWKLIKEDGIWKLDKAEIALINVSPSTNALIVAGFVYAYSNPAQIEDWRIRHNVKKSNKIQEIHDQAVWMDEHPDVLALNIDKIKQLTKAAGQPQPGSSDQVAQQNNDTKNQIVPVNRNSSNYTQIGNTLFGSDGSNYTRIGNTTFGSDGSNYTEIGNTLFGNDGTSYTQIGDTVFGSDGSSSTKIGNTTFINP